MIKQAYLNKQLDKTRHVKKISPFLRRLVFFVVDSALREFYSETYSMKCLQSSVAIRLILKEYGIKSREFAGALCVSQVYNREDKIPNWNGFWGEDHHVWLTTEYGELVDLTINYLHLHPLSKDKIQIEVPAVWWSDMEVWPRILKYLPDAPINIMLPDEDAKDLEEFKLFVLKKYNQVVRKKSVSEIDYGPFLHGIESFNQMHIDGNPWLRRSYIFEEMDIPHPSWIQKREAELIRNYESKQKT